MSIASKAIILADEASSGTGFTHTKGVFEVEVTLAADSTVHSAIFTLYNNAGTPTTVLTAGNGTYFSITKGTDDKVNLYYESGELKVENQLGQEETIYVSKG